jgi:hypothetical protein
MREGLIVVLFVLLVIGFGGRRHGPMVLTMLAAFFSVAADPEGGIMDMAERRRAKRGGRLYSESEWKREIREVAKVVRVERRGEKQAVLRRRWRREREVVLRGKELLQREKIRMERVRMRYERYERKETRMRLALRWMLQWGILGGVSRFYGQTG